MDAVRDAISELLSRISDGANWQTLTNFHATVKPLDLMRYLCKLTATPKFDRKRGIVLDPFMGSGTTGMAATMECREFIGIEIDADYYEIAKRRIAWAGEQVQQLALEGI